MYIYIFVNIYIYVQYIYLCPCECVLVLLLTRVPDPWSCLQSFSFCPQSSACWHNSDLTALGRHLKFPGMHLELLCPPRNRIGFVTRWKGGGQHWPAPITAVTSLTTGTGFTLASLSFQGVVWRLLRRQQEILHNLIPTILVTVKDVHVHGLPTGSQGNCFPDWLN